jgi:hypothetical protein
MAAPFSNPIMDGRPVVRELSAQNAKTHFAQTRFRWMNQSSGRRIPDSGLKRFPQSHGTQARRQTQTALDRIGDRQRRYGRSVEETKWGSMQKTIHSLPALRWKPPTGVIWSSSRRLKIRGQEETNSTNSHNRLRPAGSSRLSASPGHWLAMLGPGLRFLLQRQERALDGRFLPFQLVDDAGP